MILIVILVLIVIVIVTMQQLAVEQVFKLGCTISNFFLTQSEKRKQLCYSVKRTRVKSFQFLIDLKPQSSSI